MGREYRGGSGWRRCCQTGDDGGEGVRAREGDQTGEDARRMTGRDFLTRVGLRRYEWAWSRWIRQREDLGRWQGVTRVTPHADLWHGLTS